MALGGRERGEGGALMLKRRKEGHWKLQDGQLLLPKAVASNCLA
jgi:hypothetical protein